MTEERIDEGINNYRDSPNFTDGEKAALEYSELMQFAPDEIDATLFERLRRHYSDAQIVELGTFIGFNVGYHTFFRTLDFYPMFSPDGRLISQDESRQVYGDRPVSHLDGPIDRERNLAERDRRANPDD